MNTKTMLQMTLLSVIAFSAVIFYGCTKKTNQLESGDSKTQMQKGQAVYRCPMHSHVRSNQPGECPICHMNLEKIPSIMNSAQAAESPTEKKIKYYRNPMDPSIHSDKPAKDNMGMDYIPVYETGKATNKSPATDPVAGRGAFSLTPDQVKLSGTSEVSTEKQDLIAEIRVPGRILNGSRVSFQVFEQDTALIKPGMEFEAETPSAPGEIITGKVTFSDSLLDPMTRTLRVDGVISSHGKYQLKTEASIVGKLKIKLPNVLSIPEKSILHSGTRDLVYVSDGNGGFTPRVVVLGVKANGRYEVRSGLMLGEKISSGPNFLLDSESRIESSND